MQVRDAMSKMVLTIGPGHTLRQAAEAKALTFEAEVSPPDLLVRADRRALSQIVINLINNAIKYTDHGEVCVTLSSDETNATIGVSDTGSGIRQEDQAKLFKAFGQLDTSSTRRFEGTGLGLHLSQKLAELLGGQITFVSEWGRGSTFTLVVPLGRTVHAAQS